jgi:hypothetical protein
MSFVRIRARRDTASNWTTADPVLQEGEFGVETDTLRVKVGDGVQNWQSLPYLDYTPRATSAPPAVGTGAVGTSSDVARADHTHGLPASPSFTTVATSGNATVGGSLTVTGAIIGGAHTHAASAVTDFAEAVDDRVAALLVAGAGIAITYNDIANTLALAVSGTLDGGTYVGQVV